VKKVAINVVRLKRPTVGVSQALLDQHIVLMVIYEAAVSISMIVRFS
jgi:hypothetical protein